MLPHPALQFFPKLSTLSLQRSQEKQTLVEELEEKIEQLDILEEAVCRIIHCFPEERTFMEYSLSISSHLLSSSC